MYNSLKQGKYLAIAYVLANMCKQIEKETGSSPYLPWSHCLRADSATLFALICLANGHRIDQKYLAYNV